MEIAYICTATASPQLAASPSPDTFGSLIECMHDTTDNTSNALDLFMDSVA